MKFVVSELTASGIAQVVTPTRNINVEAIRPHLYRHNSPTGTVKIQIRSEADALIAESATVNISDIGTMNFYHGYIRFLVNASLKRGDPYTIKLVGGGGYTFSESAYVGWVNALDLGKYEVSGTPVSNFNYPLDLEVWERKNI